MQPLDGIVVRALFQWLTKLSAQALYEPDGIYSYFKDWNAKAVAAGCTGNRSEHPRPTRRRRARTVNAFYHAIQTGTSYQTVHRLRRADGEYRWHHARGEPLRDEQGRIIQWYGLAIDIEEGKRAEDQLRSTQARLARASQIATVAELSSGRLGDKISAPSPSRPRRSALEISRLCRWTFSIV